MLFELRQYRTRPGQRDNWVKFAEEQIIPFQTEKGMVIVGSWVGEQEQDQDLFVWIRKFDSEADRVVGIVNLGAPILVHGKLWGALMAIIP